MSDGKLSEQARDGTDVHRPTVLLSICDSRSKTALDNFNVGNRLFVYACARHVLYDLDINDLAVRPSIGTLLLPFPNFIRENDELLWLEDFILATDPQSVVLLCGGIQADNRQKLKLPAAAIRALQLISERSALMGVRGQFTAEVLDDCGIRNVEVIGCPSMHWWMDPDFKVVADPGESSNVAGGVVSATPDGNFANELAELYAFGSTHDLPYILQTEFYFAGLLGAQQLPVSQDHLDWVLANYRPHDITVDAFRDWIARRACHFSDVPQWIGFMRRRDYSIGARLHGTIASILAGKPARVLWHDERVREVAKFFGIPAAPLRGQTRASITDLVPRDSDMDGFNRRYRETLDTYVRFLQKNNLRLTPQLARIAPADV